MHTAICTFEDRAQAEQAAERLVQSGFDRREVHVEHRHPDGSPMADGEGRDHDVVGKFSFFERLFGGGKHAPHAEKYQSAVERGLYVVLVEGRDEAEAQRAQDVLHGLNPADFNLVQRTGERPLRDVVAERGSSLEQRFGTAREDMAAGHRMDVRREGQFFPPERGVEGTAGPSGEPATERPMEHEPERAIASQGWGEQRRLEVVDDDKPIASPDLRPTRPEDKPR